MKTVTVLVPTGDARVDAIRGFLTWQVPDLVVLIVASDLVAEPYISRITGNDAASGVVERLRELLVHSLNGTDPPIRRLVEQEHTRRNT